MPSAITLDRSAHAATNIKPFASTWAPGRGPRAREKSGDGWISPKLNLVVNGDDGETATRKWAWTWISQMTVLTTPSSSLPRILMWEYDNLQWPTVQYVIPPNKGCFHSNPIRPIVVRGHGPRNNAWVSSGRMFYNSTVPLWLFTRMTWRQWWIFYLIYSITRKIRVNNTATEKPK